ncbi:MAG: type II secretion system protein GspK, partial [Planctomycetota bacterium]
MWTLTFLAVLVLAFARSTRARILAFANQVAAIQAAAVERSAEAYALAILEREKDTALQLAETYFAAVPLESGCFWILRPNYGDDSLPSFGLVDESSKLDLNSAPADMLAALPGMTADLAASIADWRDEDGEVTAGGAEDEYYLALPDPYHAKNGPFESVEEVLLVKDFTAELLYGTGLGSRYGADPTWFSGVGSLVRTDLELARGLYDDLTVWGSASQGPGGGPTQALNVNQDNPLRLTELLTSVLGAERAREVAERARPRPPFRDLFDFAVRTGLSGDELDLLADRLTTGEGAPSGAALNVNTAPREVLRTLPGLTDADVTSLIARRALTGGADTGIGWVLDALGSKAVGLGDRIATKPSSRYSADILAVSEDGRAFRRTRIVIDASSSPPRIVYRRDLTESGWPLDPALLYSLRRGEATSGAMAAYGGGL